MESDKIMGMHICFPFCFGIRANRKPCCYTIIESVEIMLCCKSRDRMSKEKGRKRKKTSKLTEMTHEIATRS